MVCSPDSNTDFFDIVIGVFQGDTLIPFSIHNLTRLCAININEMKKKWFCTKRERSIGYPTETITVRDYEDDLVLFPNATAQAESLLHNLEQAARGIGLYVHSDKTDLISFKQDGATSISKDKSLKLEVQFSHLSNNISSTESKVNIHIRKA